MSLSTKTLMAASTFDPYANRDLGTSGTKNWQALVHLLKGAIGTGILAMPKGFTYTGWLLGLVYTGVVAFLCCYGILVLARCQYLLCKRNEVKELSYSVSMREALMTGPSCLSCLAPIAIPFVEFFLILFQLGICSVYVIFVGSTAKTLIEQHCDLNINVRAYYMISLIPCIIMMMIRDLRQMTPIIFTANMVIILGLAFIYYFVFQNFPSINSVPMFKSVLDVPNFLGICLFALEGIGVIVTVKSKMIQPDHFGGPFGVLSMSFIIAGTLYAALGFFGYVKYGEKTADTITLNLPEKNVISMVIQILYCLAIIITYGLQGFVPYDMIWTAYWQKKYGGTNREFLMDTILRMSMVVVPFLMALAIPKLGGFIGLVGAFCLSMLGFVFPGVMEICVLHPDQYGCANWMLLKNLGLILFGFCVLVIGCTTTIIDMLK